MISYPTNITDIVGVVSYTNNITNGMVGIGIVIFIFFMTLLPFKDDPVQAFTVASFTTFIAIVAMIPIGLLASWFMPIGLVFLCIAIFLLYNNK